MTHAAPVSNCRNCGAELHRRFCHTCGQKAGEVAVDVGDFAREVAQEFLNLETAVLHSAPVLLGAFSRVRIPDSFHNDASWRSWSDWQADWRHFIPFDDSISFDGPAALFR